MKYVIFHSPARHIDVPRFCLAPESHAKLAEDNRALGEPISAGFLRVHPHGVIEAFGGSESLGLQAAPGDSVFLTALFRATQELGATYKSPASAPALRPQPFVH